MFNLGNHKRGNFHLVSDENKMVQYFTINIILKMVHSNLSKGSFDKIGDGFPRALSRSNTERLKQSAYVKQTPYSLY